MTEFSEASPESISGVVVHRVEDGLPGGDSFTGRVAFIWDGALISGWPISYEERDEIWQDINGDSTTDPREAIWEGSEARCLGPYAGVEFWLEFPVEFWNIGRSPSGG